MLLKSPIRYSQSWEDHRVIEKGLKIKKGDNIVSILASGDNFLNMITLSPKSIYGFDKNIGQFYEVKLKIQAINELEYDDFITFLGYSGKKEERKKIYYSLSKKLDRDTYAFWKQHNKIILEGIATQGLTEKRISLQRKLIKFILGKQYEYVINLTDSEEKKRIFEKKIDKDIFRNISKIINNRFVSHFIHKKELVANLPKNFEYNKLFWKKIRHIFLDINIRESPYLYWSFKGELPEEKEFWQPYLKKEKFGIIKENLDKIKIFNKNLHHGLKDIKSNTIDSFYISDIFDWMSYNDINKNLLEIRRVAKNNAKMICFVIMNDKGINNELKSNFIYLQEESNRLFDIDRIGFYPKINLWKIKK